MLKPACELVHQLYEDAGFEPGFCSLLPALYAKAEYRVRNPTLPSRAGTRQASPVDNNSAEERANVGSLDRNRQTESASNRVSDDTASSFNPEDYTLDGIGIDNFFPLLFGSGYTMDPLADFDSLLLQNNLGLDQQQNVQTTANLFDIAEYEHSN